MAEYPSRGSSPWDLELKDYIDTGVVDAVADAAEVQMAGVELGYAETSVLYSTASTTPAFISTLLVGPIIGQGRRVDVEFYSPNAYNQTADGGVLAWISKNGAATLTAAEVVGVVYSPKNNGGVPLHLKACPVLEEGVEYSFRVACYCSTGVAVLLNADYAKSYLSVVSR